MLLFVPLFANAAVDYQEFKKERSACYAQLNSKCFYKLLMKYSNEDKVYNFVKYDYGVALMAEKEYTKAKTSFQNVVNSEKNSAELVEYAKKRIAEINEYQKNVYKANSQDKGDYYNSGASAKWQDPKKINVKVAGRTGKEYLIKNAFRTWALKSGYLVDFTFVTDPNAADITCSFVESLGKEHAGITYTKTATTRSGAKYITKADVKISLTNQMGGKYTDKNLESIALHEVGHALGIIYHSDNINDIMYYSTESYKNGSISRRDANTLKALYGVQK